MRHCRFTIHGAALPLYSICCISMLPFYSSLLHCCSTVFLAVRAALPLCYTLRGIAALQYVLHCSIAALQYSLLYFLAVFLAVMRHCRFTIHGAALPLYSICCISMLPFYSSLLHCCSTVFLAVRAALPLCYTLRGIAALQYVLHCSIAALQYSLLYFLAGVWLQEIQYSATDKHQQK